MTTATEVKEHPILFKGPLVRAILEGRKTVTRRVIKPQPSGEDLRICKEAFDWSASLDGSSPYYGLTAGDQHWEETSIRFPYGLRGDRLWVKENFRPVKYQGGTGLFLGTISKHIEYAASEGELLSLKCVEANDGTCRVDAPLGKLFDSCGWFAAKGTNKDRWRPSIHMPRWASRIDLEITYVCVERIQDITTKQILAEGIEIPFSEKGTPLVQISGKYPTCDYLPREGATWDDLVRAWFASTWDQINGPRGFGWKANPWVWVIEFKRVRP